MAIACIWTALQRWLRYDMLTYKTCQVESFFNVHTVHKPMIGFLDCLFDDHVVVDWKFFSSDPDAWERRIRNGNQGQVYNTYTTADQVIFRGVHKKTFQTYEVVPKDGKDSFADVMEAMIEADMTGRWRRNTHSCWAYKRKCPYFDGCLGDAVDPFPPNRFEEGTIVQHFSSNSIDEFMLCPQKYRRRRLVEIRGLQTGTEYEEEDSADSRVGTLAHLGMSIIYATAFGQDKINLRDPIGVLDLAQFKRE